MNQPSLSVLFEQLDAFGQYGFAVHTLESIV
jgi:hypothetical protein